MTIFWDGSPVEFQAGESYLDIRKRLQPDSYQSVLGIRIGGRTLPLVAHPEDGQHVSSLRFDNEEGLRIYERSLRFVLLLSLKQLHPKARVRVENSTAKGIYVKIDGVDLTDALAVEVEARMRELVKQDLRFQKRVISRTDAIKFFEAEGYIDKVRLLKYRPFEHFQLYDCEGMLEYFYGEMAPSTGFVPVFHVTRYFDGLELLLPDKQNLSETAPFSEQLKLQQTFVESASWAKILGCENCADLNELVLKRGLREFIRINEALQEKAIGNIADQFTESGAQLICVAGPSSSGKTTFTHRLEIALRVSGFRPTKLSLDDYYLNRNEIPLDENGEPDLERLDSLDVDLFNEQLPRLLNGEMVEVPTFDFRAGCRSQQTHKLQIEPGQPVLIEGIHALNPGLTQTIERARKYLIYISALTTLNLDDHNRIRTTDVRLLRRLVRDHQFRGTPPEGTLSMWSSVRRGESLYIFPFQENADTMFNSSLVYELAILKKYAYPLLLEVPESSPFYTRACRLLKFLNYVKAASVEDEIPLNSILREFIGGCCFYKEHD